MPETALGIAYGAGFLIATAFLNASGIGLGIAIQNLATSENHPLRWHRNRPLRRLYFSELNSEFPEGTTQQRTNPPGETQLSYFASARYRRSARGGPVNLAAPFIDLLGSIFQYVASRGLSSQVDLPCKRWPPSLATKTLRTLDLQRMTRSALVLNGDPLRDGFDGDICIKLADGADRECGR